MHITRRPLLAAMLGAATTAQAQTAEYPTRPIRVIVPFAPGGASDFAARILQPPFGEALGQPIVIENRTGAAGNVGMDVAARAAPDGYTLFLGNVGTLSVNPSMFAKTIRVNPNQDFSAISLVAETPGALVVSNALPVETTRDFVAYVKARPGQLHYGSPGSGSLNRLEMEKLREVAGLDMVHVPYPGGAGQASAAMLAGDVQCMFITLSSILGQVQAGRVRLLGITGTRRVAALPQTPTLVESGFPDFDSGSWQGLLAPAGTPPEIVKRLHAVTLDIMARPAIKQRFEAAATEVVVSDTPQAFATFIRREEERWGALVRRIGAAAE